MNKTSAKTSAKKDEALKMAIEALNTLMMEKGSIYQKAIQACKEALEQPMINGLTKTETNQTMSVKGLSEQPAQEPVEISTSGTFPLPKVRYESYQWQGLSDDEVNNIYPCAEGVHDFRDIVRAIEQALKEKNT